MVIVEALTEDSPWLLSSGVDVPVLPALLSLLGAGVFLVFALQALRSAAPTRRRARPVRPPLEDEIHIAPAPPPPEPLPPPAPSRPARRAPIGIHFPAIRPEFPDVWGVGEPLDIVLRVEEKGLQSLRQLPGLEATIEGETVNPTFTRGTATLRHTFSSVGEKAIVLQIRFKQEPTPRRTERQIKVVEYRTEIADVFSNFREEASRAITPIRDDATPWEIYDILTSANTNLPESTLREIISSFEEAKYSNHPVTRATYERMITALLQLERVEL